jgi:hypothetical protein
VLGIPHICGRISPFRRLSGEPPLIQEAFFAASRRRQEMLCISLSRRLRGYSGIGETQADKLSENQPRNKKK